MAPEGIAIKLPDEIITIKKEDLRDIDLFRGVRKMNLRIISGSGHISNTNSRITSDNTDYTSNTVYDLNNVDENYIDELKRAVAAFFHMSLYVKELEVSQTVEGSLGLNGQGMLEFLSAQTPESRGGKTIFDLPLKAISGVVEIKNEICINAENLELRFVTPNVAEIKEACTARLEPEICVFEDLSVLFPRGKNNFVFFKEYFRMVGSTYDHKIRYKSVGGLYALEKGRVDEEMRYVVIRVPGLRQGQTVYEFVVLNFGDTEVEIEINGSMRTGPLWRVFVEVLEENCGIKATTSDYLTRDKMRGLRCSTKAYDGALYPLEKELVFLPRAIVMPSKEISAVEFSRINLSAMQAKTFDMTVFSGTAVNFTGIAKEEFGGLEAWFNERRIVVRSEVIDDYVSDEESFQESDDSSIIDSEGDE